MVYGVLYAVLEMVGYQLDTVGWDLVTPLLVASALVDALLAIVVAIAVLVLYDVGRRRWGPAVAAWQERHLAAAEDPREPIGVPSWRPGTEPPSVPLPAPPPSGGTYGVHSRGQRFPEDPGRLL